jgi:hypothetical protein
MSRPVMEFLYLLSKYSKLLKKLYIITYNVLDTCCRTQAGITENHRKFSENTRQLLKYFMVRIFYGQNILRNIFSGYVTQSV